MEFLDTWESARDENEEFDSELFDNLRTFDYYKMFVKRSESEISKKLRKIIVHKKLFSIPWLLCYENLFTLTDLE